MTAPSGKAWAQRGGVGDRTEVAKAVSPEGDDEVLSRRWRGSYVAFDQSVTTQTVRLGADFQSSNPVYEWWLSAKPQYFIVDRPRDRFSVSLWMNAFLELTDSDTTTKQRELLLGPTFVTAPYLHVFGGRLADRPGYRTALSVGPRFILPTDKASWSSGQRLSAGLATFLSQGVPLRGENARLWQGAQLTLGLTLGAPLNRATTPSDPNLNQERLDVAGRLVQSDQLRGQFNTKSSLNLSLAADVQVTKRWTLSASYVWLDSWAYRPTNELVCNLATGCVEPIQSTNAPNFRVSTWLTASVSYDVTRRLGLSLGYYNRANQIGPDGQRRSPLWSPEARLFLTVTGTIPDK